MVGMRRKFLIRGEYSESNVRTILDSIVQSIDRATHKVTYRTSKGVVEYISLPVRSNSSRYRAEGISTTLRKISLWNRDTTEELEQLLRSNGIDMVEIIKDGPQTLELKS
jgi:hypothetical protein